MFLLHIRIVGDFGCKGVGMKYQMWGRVLSVGRYLDASDLPFLGGGAAPRP